MSVTLTSGKTERHLIELKYGEIKLGYLSIHFHNFSQITFAPLALVGLLSNGSRC